MKINENFLKEKGADLDEIEWFLEKYQEQEQDSVEVIVDLIGENKLNWANWLLAWLFDRNKKIKYATFAAEQVLDIFEKEYPEDQRPRRAIEAAKKCLIDDSAHAKAAALDAAYDAAYGATAATPAYDAAKAAAYAANIASAYVATSDYDDDDDDDDDTAAYDDYYDDYDSAAIAAGYAYAAADSTKMMLKILAYGKSLL